MTRLHRYALSSCLVLASAGCAEPDDEVVPGDQSEAEPPELAINGGTSVIGASGAVRLNNPTQGRYCTGMALSDSFVLTSKFCAEGSAPSALTAALQVSGVEVSSRGKRVLFHPGELDVALVELESRLYSRGYASFSNPLWFGSSQVLVGEKMRCTGYGNRSGAADKGSQQSADLVVNALEANGTLKVTPADSWVSMQAGDRGGACTFNRDLASWITGVGSVDGAGNWTEVSAEHFRDWVHIETGLAVGLYEHAGYGGAYRALEPFTAASGTQLLPTDNSVSSVRVPNGWHLTLTDDRSASPASMFYTASSGWLDSFNDRASVATVDQRYNLFADAGFGGKRGNLFDSFNADWLARTVGDNAISSLIVPKGMRMVVYPDAGYQGYSGIFYEGMVGYVGDDWNDRISSIRLETGAYVADRYGLEGNRAILWAGDYDWNEMGVQNDSIVSLSVPVGCTVEVFEHAGFSGASRLYKEEGGQLVYAHLYEWANRISSIRIRRL